MFAPGVSLDTTSFIPNSLCAARASDGHYYRGKLCLNHYDGNFLIELIDYGRKEVIHFENLKRLDEKHRHECKFAIKAYLAVGPPRRTMEKNPEIETLERTKGKILQATEIKQSRHDTVTFTLDLLIERHGNKESLCKHLITNKFAYAVPSN